MNTTSTASSKLHPVFWIAGIAVTLFSLVGIASLTGLLPSRSSTAPAAGQQAAATPAGAAAPAASAEAPPAAKQEAAATTRHEKTAHKAVHPKSREAAQLPPPAGAGVPPDYAAPKSATCADCGVIDGIRQVTHEGQATGLGAVGGGIVGGALANNIGQGNGRTLATIAGIVGGGLLGNKIEKSQRATTTYEVTVKMDDGTSHVVNYDTLPPWRIGDSVKLANGALTAR